MSHAALLWTPSPQRARASQMHAFMTRMAGQYSFASDWPSLHRWSVEHRDQFWAEMLRFAEIQPTRPAKATCEGQGMLGTRWFPGMELNFAAHLLRFGDDRVALAAEDELGRTRSITYRELRRLVGACAEGLREAGVRRGDRVVGFLPNIPEAVIAMLAAASLGASWSSCSPDFGMDGVFDRFGQITPKVLFTADAYSYGGKTIDSLGRVRGIVERIPSIDRVVVVPFISDQPNLAGIRGASHWADFLGLRSEDAFSGRGANARGNAQPQIPNLKSEISNPRSSGIPNSRSEISNVKSQISDLKSETLGGKSIDNRSRCTSGTIDKRPQRTSGTIDNFVPVPFDHPLYIMYSSGTTGVPKCIVHGAGGTLLQHMKELMLHCDLRREDVIFYFTTCGWMMWNWLVSGLGIGATVVLYEGNPGYPTPDRLWRMAERLGITVFGTSPRFVAACEQAGLHPGTQHDLSKLRAVLSTGSPLTVESFRWVYQNVKTDLQLSSICGGTDIISCFMLGNPILPVYAGEIQCCGLGMDVHAFDEAGKPVTGKKGELVCCSPFPSQPTGFWNDPDGSKYRKAYFEAFPDCWHHGDFVEITERGGVIVYGRSDATLNPGGVRIGTAEIYRQVETIEEIVDSIVVGKNTPDADVEICLFVVLREGAKLDAGLIDRTKKRIAEGTTKRHVPKHIKQVTAVPYTISGKKVEIAVTRMIHGEPVPNRDALKNPEALDQYARIV